jgi:multiple sugar transport system substrate-binding protein
MKKFWSMALSSILVAASLAGCGAGKENAGSSANNGPVTLNAIFMKQAGYSEDDITSITKEFMSKNPNIKVNTTFVPYEALEQKILTGAPNGGYDVVLIDAPWTAKFAKAGIVQEVTDKLSEADRQDIFAGALDAVSYEGKLYGLPWLNDTKFLFYNKEMLKKAGFSNPPKTWDELMAQAKVIKEKGIVEYPIVWSWKQAEALSCDFTTLSETFGGKLVRDGKPTLTDEGNQKALDFMVQSLKDGISNPKSTEFLEEDVRGVFSSGKAAFALNWTYMYNLANDKTQSQVAGQVGIAPSPGQGSVVSASVNGGMGVALAKGSKHPEEAWKYMEYLSSKEVQKKYAKNALPIWKSLYDDKDVIATNPEVVAASKVQYNYLANRPQVPWYGSLSTELQVSIQQALLGQKSTKDALAELQQKAEELANK